MEKRLEQCGGTIKDGLCMKCFDRASSTSNTCINMYEVYTPSESSDKGEEEILKEAIGQLRYNLNGSVTNKQLLWAMQEYASIKEKEAHNKAVQECIDAINLDGRELHQIAQDKFNLTPSSPIEEFKRGLREMRAIAVTELEKLKR